MGSIKVFRMNDDLWVAAATYAAARIFCEAEDLEIDEAYPPEPMTLAELEAHVLDDEDGSEPQTFAALLGKMKSEDVEFPCVFAEKE